MSLLLNFCPLYFESAFFLYGFYSLSSAITETIISTQQTSTLFCKKTTHTHTQINVHSKNKKKINKKKSKPPFTFKAHKKIRNPFLAFVNFFFILNISLNKKIIIKKKMFIQTKKRMYVSNS